MDLNAIKADIHSLVEKQSDPLVLGDILTILEGAGNDAVKEKLSTRALQSEEDICSGKIYNVSDARKRLNLHKP